MGSFSYELIEALCWFGGDSFARAAGNARQSSRLDEGYRFLPRVFDSRKYPRRLHFGFRESHPKKASSNNRLQISALLNAINAKAPSAVKPLDEINEDFFGRAFGPRFRQGEKDPDESTVLRKSRC